jgi:ferric-dicitrate binding protein FerR (iron transport regulator)
MANTEQNPRSSEELLSAALRRLARSSPQAASPELARVLVQAFHRRHRRRTIRLALAVAAGIAFASGLLWWRLVARNPSEPFTSNQQTGQQYLIGLPAESEVFADASTFVALPSFASSRPDEELRILRVEMPVSSLRLLGARVNDELSTQQIVADLLIGTDGTPYAFRIIS